MPESVLADPTKRHFLGRENQPVTINLMNKVRNLLSFNA